jgi:arginyl-tRNA synthetase
VIQNAAHNHSPALLANFTYDLVREYNFLPSSSILEKKIQVKKYLEFSCSKVADTIASSFKLLGIAVPKECNMSALWRYNGVNQK